jgi:hypothetical protein
MDWKTYSNWKIDDPPYMVRKKLFGIWVKHNWWDFTLLFWLLISRLVHWENRGQYHGQVCRLSRAGFNLLKIFLMQHSIYITYQMKMLPDLPCAKTHCRRAGRSRPACLVRFSSEQVSSSIYKDGFELVFMQGLSCANITDDDISVFCSLFWYWSLLHHWSTNLLEY